MKSDRRQLRRSTGAQRLYAAQDANYNVTALIGTDGQVKERFQYSPYGQRTVLSSHWTAATDQYAFLYAHQGGRTDPATGLIHFQARDYNPALGTWMQQDYFAGYKAGMNLYEMEKGNPLTWLDPSGHLPFFEMITGASVSNPVHCYICTVKDNTSSWVPFHGNPINIIKFGIAQAKAIADFEAAALAANKAGASAACMALYNAYMTYW